MYLFIFLKHPQTFKMYYDNLNIFLAVLNEKKYSIKYIIKNTFADLRHVSH